MRINGLDPLLAPAEQLERLPVIERRRWAQTTAEQLMASVEVIAVEMAGEQDRESQAQLRHLAEALGVAVISLVAYARGRVPKVGRAPGGNVIVPGGRDGH